MNHENAVRPCAEADALKLVQSLRALDDKQLLQAAIERGLTFGDCINAFGVPPEGDAFVSGVHSCTAGTSCRMKRLAFPSLR